MHRFILAVIAAIAGITIIAGVHSSAATGSVSSVQCDGPPHPNPSYTPAIQYLERYTEWDSYSGTWLESGPTCLRTTQIILYRWNGSSWATIENTGALAQPSGTYGRTYINFWPNHNGPYSPGTYRTWNVGCNVNGCTGRYSPNYILP